VSVERARSIRLDGALCVAARKRLGLTREALDGRSGISIATLKRAENGKAIYVATASILARSLGVPLRTLLHPSERDDRVAELERSHADASIAVLPFAIIGSDEAAKYVAQGLAEDLIHRLSRSLFPVIAPSSTFSRRDEAVTTEALSEQLGAGYVVLGALQLASTRVRVNARVVRSRDQRVLCSRQYECGFRDLFAAQDELSARIVEQIGATVLDAEAAPLLRRDPADMDGWELAVRGSWHFHARSREGNAEARAFFERALSVDPDLPLAWYSLAMTHQRDIVNQWSRAPTESLLAMRRVCKEFEKRYPQDPWSHLAASYVAVYSGERSSAVARLSEAIQLDPNSPAAYSLYGQVLAMGSDPDRAIEQFELALRLSPLDAEIWSVYTAMALAHFVAQRYSDTVDWAERATRARPEMPFPHGTLASALGHLGRLPEARQSLERMLELAPHTSLEGMARLVASTDPEIAHRYQAGLKLAGLPA
jgi:adenylate cyclase